MIITFKDGTRHHSNAKTEKEALTDYLKRTKGDASRVFLVGGKKVTTTAIDAAKAEIKKQSSEKND